MHTLIENISKGDFSIISCTPRSSQITQIPLLNPRNFNCHFLLQETKSKMRAESGKELGATDTQALYKGKKPNHTKVQITAQAILYL